MTFKDHFSGRSPDYRKYRPAYPAELFAFLAETAPARNVAWDSGTGTGQAAVGLARHFTKVIATDPSAEQLGEAERHERIEYRQASAECSGLAGGSVDLVTVAQALHWFDFDRFYAEVRHVSRASAICAVWSYGFHRVNPAVDQVLARYENEFVGPYWPPERRYVNERYQTIPFPFPELPAPKFEMAGDWDLPGLLGYLGTWSATKRFLAAQGFDPLARLHDEFAAAWGNPTEVRTVCWDLHLRVGRVL